MELDDGTDSLILHGHHLYRTADHAGLLYVEVATAKLLALHAQVKRTFHTTSLFLALLVIHSFSV